MRIDTEDKDAYIVSHLIGRMDLEGTDAAAVAFDKLIAEMKSGGRLVIDFSGVDYISSAGIRVFVSAMKKIQLKGVRVVSCGLNLGVEEIFRFSGLDAVFKICESETEAAQALDTA
ncbi:MAG: STAS domain-containing protein [bacterium]|nr:STAS domain-containing protein [Candidatus Sumerlaeota bacterium]